MKKVQFFFSIGSRYSYLASTQLTALQNETGCSFHWRPVFSSDLIRKVGRDPFNPEERRGQYQPQYRNLDATRWARLYGVPYRDPIWEHVDWRMLALAAVAASFKNKTEQFATALFALYFAQEQPDSTAEAIALAARQVGLEGNWLDASAEVEHRKNVTDALEAGAFGVPTFVTEDGQLFWGQDRFPLLRHHLLSGGG